MKTDRYLFRGIIAQPDELFSGFAYGDLLQYANGDVVIRQRETGQEWNVIPETVGQFTGIFDKNGTMIFEGDVFKSWIRPFYEITDIQTFYYDCLEYCQLSIGEQSEDIEIIGNIHDK